MKKLPEAAIPERKRGEGVKFVYEILRDDILNLVLPPGSPIDEIQLSERLSMSRTPIREALVRLAGEGLVTTLPNRSTVVSNIDFLNLHTFFDALTLMYRVTTRLAAEYRTEADLAQIRAVVARYDTMKPADVITKLKPLATPGNAYFGSAGELVAHAYLDQGKNAEAGALFAQIANDEKTPESLRSRARQMAGVLGVDAVKDVDALLKEQGVSSDGTAPANATAPAAPQG